MNLVRQFFVLTRRYLDLVLRDKLLLTVLMIIMPVIGLLLLLISGPNWLVGDTEAEIGRQLAADLADGEQSATYAIVGKSQTLLLMLSLAAVLLGLFAAAYEIVKERSIYQRERMVTLRLLPYLASKVAVLGAFAMLQCLLLLFVISWKVDLPGAGVFLPASFEMYVTLVLGTLAAIMMGLLVSTLAPNTNTVIYVVLLALFFQIIFAGVIFDLPGVAGDLSTLTLTRWTMEGLGTSVNMEHLNGLTCTHFQPDPITEEVELDVSKPDPEWEPVTVVTETREIIVPCPSGINVTVPITVPEVTTHEMVTVTETVTETKTFTPTVQEITGEREFQIDYTHTAGHLCWDWLLLLGFALALGVGTVVVLKRKDVG